MSSNINDGGTLELTDDGIEMPDMLKGYVGQFEIKTAKITAQFNTTDQGLSTDDYSDTVWAHYPESGDYNAGLAEGEMVIQARGYPDTKFTIQDNREDNE